MTRKYSRKKNVAFSLRTDDTFIMISPPEYGDRLKEFVRRLRKCTLGRRILVKDPTHFHDFALPFCKPFEGIIDMDDVAKRAKCDNRSWDGLSREITKGAMCVRGSMMSGSAYPSVVAQEHEKLRLSLMYEFGRRYDRELLIVKPKPPSTSVWRKHHFARE